MEKLARSARKKERILRKMLSLDVATVLKRLHFPVDVILLCVRWCAAYLLSLHNIDETMAEHGIEVNHSTVHRWGLKPVPLLEKAFRKHKRPVGKSWRMDETYITVRSSEDTFIRPWARLGTRLTFCF